MSIITCWDLPPNSKNRNQKNYMIFAGKLGWKITNGTWAIDLDQVIIQSGAHVRPVTMEACATWDNDRAEARFFGTLDVVAYTRRDILTDGHQQFTRLEVSLHVTWHSVSHWEEIWQDESIWYEGSTWYYKTFFLGTEERHWSAGKGNWIWLAGSPSLCSLWLVRGLFRSASQQRSAV